MFIHIYNRKSILQTKMK